eukprot:m.48267 g.48267  ORF g.48267 m.48267 type:complete len:57 (+) comp13276_c0_seq11:1590-1760(+)
MRHAASSSTLVFLKPSAAVIAGSVVVDSFVSVCWLRSVSNANHRRYKPLLNLYLPL